MPGQRAPLWDRFWSKVDMSGGLFACWPWLGAKSKKRNGTRRGHIQLAGRGTPMVLAHVVAKALSTDGEFVKHDPETGERLEVRHLCGARWGNCCNPQHLEWGTPEENRQDRYRSGASDVDALPSQANQAAGLRGL